MLQYITLVLDDAEMNFIDKTELNKTAHLNKLIADVITVLLRRINVSQDEIETITDKIYQRRYQEMFTLIEEYDVQETRRIARNEGKLEDAFNIVKELNTTVSKAIEVTKLPDDERKNLISELKRNNIPFTL